MWSKLELFLRIKLPHICVLSFYSDKELRTEVPQVSVYHLSYSDKELRSLTRGSLECLKITFLLVLNPHPLIVAKQTHTQGI